MNRTTQEELAMVGGYRAIEADRLTALLRGVVRGHPIVRHRAGMGSEVGEFFESAGRWVEEQTLAYDTLEEAEEIADKMIAEGRRLVSSFPLRSGRFLDRNQLVPPALYSLLNDKVHLARWVPREHMPRRELLSLAQFESREFQEAAVIKGTGNPATGTGAAVMICETAEQWAEAKLWVRKQSGFFNGVAVEQYLDFEVCWCANIAVSASRAWTLGGAEQLFGEPTKQVGSVIDPARPLPVEAAKLSETVGEAARLAGYCGFAGMDIGRTSSGQFVVVDLNFRVNGSLSQLVFHPAAAARLGLDASRSFRVDVSRPISDVLRLLAPGLEAGTFVPTRLFNGDKHPLGQGRHTVQGFVMGVDRADAERAAADLARLLSSGPLKGAGA